MQRSITLQNDRPTTNVQACSISGSKTSTPKLYTIQLFSVFLLNLIARFAVKIKDTRSQIHSSSLINLLNVSTNVVPIN